MKTTKNMKRIVFHQASVNMYSTEQINYEYVDFKNVDTTEKIWKLIFWSMKIKILQSKIVMRVYMEFIEMIYYHWDGKEDKIVDPVEIAVNKAVI